MFCQNCFLWQLVIEFQLHLHNLIKTICIVKLFWKAVLDFFFFYWLLWFWICCDEGQQHCIWLSHIWHQSTIDFLYSITLEVAASLERCALLHSNYLTGLCSDLACSYVLTLQLHAHYFSIFCTLFGNHGNIIKYGDVRYTYNFFIYLLFINNYKRGFHLSTCPPKCPCMALPFSVALALYDVVDNCLSNAVLFIQQYGCDGEKLLTIPVIQVSSRGVGVTTFFCLFPPCI